MTIEEFAAQHGNVPLRLSRDVACQWRAEKLADDFLGTPVALGVTMADLLKGDGLGDSLSANTREAFEGLMGARADTRREVVALIQEKLANGDNSAAGLLSKIQGQVGEHIFRDLVGSAAHLAENKSQEGWDVFVSEGSRRGHWQVKVYASDRDACRALDDLHEKVRAGVILDGDDHAIDKVHFAVSSEIHDRVRAHAEMIGFAGDVDSLGVTHEQIRAGLKGDFANVANPFEHFFGELFGDVATAAAVQAAAHGLRLALGADRRGVGEDYLEAVSATGVAIVTAELVEQAFDWLEKILDVSQAGDPTGATLVASILTRRLARRLVVHRFQVHRKLYELVGSFERARSLLDRPGAVQHA